MFCPLCNNSVAVSFPTVGLVSGCRVQCGNDLCSFVHIDKPERARITLPEGSGSPLIERTTDYAGNVLFVTAMLACGSGGKEAERLLGFLGLPNSTTMEKRTFPLIEERISGSIQGLTNKICHENLVQAVKKHYGNREHEGQLLFDLWQRQLNNEGGEEILPSALYPRLMTSADMGWQKRSSGNSYDSLSGDATLVECSTRMPILWSVRSKICGVCSRHDHNEGPPRQHTCRINHQGSAGAMEPLAVLGMVTEAFNTKCVIISCLITDDDSSMKAKMKWSNEDWMLNNNTDVKPKIINKNGNLVRRPNHGELPRNIPEPAFLADPNHRKKTLKGVLYRHFKKKVGDRDGLTRVDIMRVTTNFAYMMRTLLRNPVEEHESCGQAVIEHHFDNHEHCGSFCKRKNLSAEEKLASKKIYRCKKKHHKLYLFLSNAIARFITKDALKEVAHGSDTQVNESLNNSVSWFAQKNKTYAGTSSLSNRVCLALGIYSIGYKAYFERLIEHEYQIVIPDDVWYYLAKQERTRNYRIAQGKTSAAKKKRNVKLHTKLKEHSVAYREKQAKEDGGAQYASGIGMDGGYVQDEQEAAAAKNNDNTAGVCTRCHKPGHLRPTNKLCEFYVPRSSSNCSSDEQAQRDAAEQEILDEVAFDNDVFFDSFEEQDEIGLDEPDGAPVTHDTAII